MKSQFRYVGSDAQCSYLPDELARHEYDHVSELSPDEYGTLLLEGWRRFGHVLFRPRCRRCTACQSLRIDVARFQPDRSQRRAWAANADTLRLEIGSPRVDDRRLELHDRFHEYQADHRGWPPHLGDDVLGYRESFVDNPIATEEWRYWLGSELVGVGYVDPVPIGLSAIYFFHDPAHRDRSLGTFNVLSLIAESARRELSHLYLGYYVAGCPSLAYKCRFHPCEVLGPDGRWIPFGTEPPAGPPEPAGGA